ncbi:RagB/SusD family nutrient uptake outer membrane protein [Mariniflexile sp.]|uniref:RagB/SusD family nutrient uptake outer membrane protein n=1 Tax=Mariniflexile sp. TaxID=1979402 RepID=UPI004048D6DC
MKKFKYIILVAALSLIGCNDDFLERYPLDQVSNEIFWTSEKDIINYNNGLYELVKDDRTIPILMGLGVGPGVNFYDGLWWLDEMSDNLGATTARALEMYKVSTGNFNVENNPRPFGYHPKGWAFVRAINFGLANYDRVPIAQNIINQYKGEARLFRGWFYADKVSRFGDMQWIDKVLGTNSPELYGKRDPRDFVMQKVLEDLNFAIANLPANWGPPNDGQDPGRIDKWVALAVKSRVCLFEGTWRKYHGLSGANTWLQESAAASTELMNTGGFSLYSTGNPMGDYRFASSSTTQATNPEVIYWRKYEPLVNGHFASRLFWNYNGGATKSFVDDFLCTDGLPIGLSPQYAGDAKIEDVFVNRDLRLRQCVLNPEDQTLLTYSNDPLNTYPRLNGMTGGRNKSNTGYHVVKHWNAVDELSPRNQHSVSPPCLRLGEVLLNYAEAKAELGTITQTDIDISINKLRDRVNMARLTTLTPPMDPAHATDGVSPLIVEIRRERRVELFLEAQRYDDLRRWKMGKYLAAPTLGMRFDAAAIARYPGAASQNKTTLVNGIPYIDVRKGTDYEPKFEDKMYLWPLPTSALSENPNLGQNPGWE